MRPARVHIYATRIRSRSVKSLSTLALKSLTPKHQCKDLVPPVGAFVLYGFLLGPESHSAHSLDRLARHLAERRYTLAPYETPLLPVFWETLVVAVTGDLYMMHAFLCLLARYVDVGGSLDDELLLPAVSENNRGHSTAQCSAPQRSRSTASIVSAMLHSLYANRIPMEHNVSAIRELASQIRILGLCCLRSSNISVQSVSALEHELSFLTQPLSPLLLASCLSLAPPVMCFKLLRTQQQIIDLHLQCLSAEERSSVDSVSRCLVDSRLFSERELQDLWQALLSNDHFFFGHGPWPSEGSDSMHSVLVYLVSRVPPTSLAAGSSALRGLDWAALLNRTSRVYARHRQGQPLLQLHRLLLHHFPGIELRVPASYVVRMLGALVDEWAEMCTHTSPATCGQWNDAKELIRWSLALFRSNDLFIRDVMVLGRKAAILFPGCDAANLLELYTCFVNAGVPPSLDKDAVHQLVRLCVEAYERSLDDAALRSLMQYFLLDTKIKFTWVLDAAAVCLTASAQISRRSEEHLAAAGATALWMLDFISKSVLPAREIVGVVVEDSPRIRKALESLRCIETSVFWWRCGCGGENAASSIHCSYCLRRARVYWTCKACHAEHSSKHYTSCRMCKEQHPRVSSAAHAGCSLCPTCSTALDEVDAAHCPKCRSVAPDVAESVASSAAAMKQCAECGAAMARRSPACHKCFAPNADVPTTKLWLCNTCNNFSYSTWSQCQRCVDPPASKSPDALIIPFAPWTCGCGQRNHPCRLACNSCSAARKKVKDEHAPDEAIQGGSLFTCRQCSQLSDCRHSSSVQMLRDSTAITTSAFRVTECQHCSFPHPRDEYVLRTSKQLPRVCFCCGHSYTTTTHADVGPWVCTVCYSLQTVDSNTYFRCGNAGCTCNSVDRWQRGITCSSCHELRPDADVDSVFVWKCVQPDSTATPDADGTVSLCDSWHYSWQTSCSKCNASRILSVAELRARYRPWTCTSCKSSHRATDVLLCPTCDEGLQEVDACERCGLAHVAWKCPTVEQIQDAERLLSAVEQCGDF